MLGGVVVPLTFKELEVNMLEKTPVDALAAMTTGSVVTVELA